MGSVSGFRRVAIDVGVDSLARAAAFYEAAFGGLPELGESDDGAVHARRPFTDDGLGATRARALAAGAREHLARVEEGGLPHRSRIEYPSGNRIVLWWA